jgi:hypothetical protein
MTAENQNENHEKIQTSIEIAEEKGTAPTITDNTVDVTVTPTDATKHHEHKHEHKHEQVYLSKKEVNNLKRNGYEQAMRLFKETFVILNKKTGMVVEMKAASSTHACNMIGWRLKNCKVMKVEIREEPKAEIKEVSALSQSPINPFPVEETEVVEIKENKENVQ